MDPSWEMEHSAIRKMTSRKNPWIPPFSSTGDPLNEGQHPHDVFYRKWLPKSISNIDQDVSLKGLPQSFGIRNAPTWPFLLEKWGFKPLDLREIVHCKTTQISYCSLYTLLSHIIPSISPFIDRFIPSISPYINRFPWPLRFGHPEAFGDRVHLGLCSTIVGRRNVHGMGELCWSQSHLESRHIYMALHTCLLHGPTKQNWVCSQGMGEPMSSKGTGHLVHESCNCDLH